MECNVQVHEKTDKRGTWAYHSVYGWYISTPAEHYRTHKCHIKAAKSERISDTVQFQHKAITNSTITHHDKVMKALAECVKIVKYMPNATARQEMRELQQLVKATAHTATS